MTTASVFIQIISVIFNVYLTKTAGAEGIGLYYLVLSVYGLSVTFASSGISLTATRLISENKTLSEPDIIKRCVLYGAAFGIAAFLILFNNAEFIGTRFLHDKRTVLSLKILSVSMPFISISSVFYGYFTAVRHAAKCSVIQVFEFLVKMLITIVLLKCLSHKGTEFACAAIFAGGAVGELLSFGMSLTLYKLERKKTFKSPRGKIMKKILSIALPVAISSFIRSALNMMRQVIVPKGLEKSGVSYKKALSDYGIINGMAMQIISFPMNILYSCSNMLVPELAEYNASGNKKQIKRIVTKVLRTTSVFAVLVFIFCFFFAENIADTIYKNAQAGHFIKLLTPVIFTMYIDAVTDGMLKGLNLQLYSMRYNVIDSSISVILLLTLLPRMGISGYIAVIYASEIINTALSVRRLIKTVYE